MHKIFLEKLNDAIGESKFVIAVNVDVRNFSTFSKSVDSAEASLFIKKIFQKIINSYFKEASFFKSTGDGLLIIYDISESSLSEISNWIISTALKLVAEFDTLCKNEPMINFSVPENCGIGISRGSATCLRTTDAILDYSGDALNIASRLMDCARPKGVVFDSKFGFELLNSELTDLFTTEAIYLKGVAEEKPINIWFTTELTKISEKLKQPLVEKKWENQIEKRKFKLIKQLGGQYFINLKKIPLDANQISLEIKHPCILNSRIKKGIITTFILDYEYFDVAGANQILVSYDDLIEKLNANKVPENATIEINVKYPVN